MYWNTSSDVDAAKLCGSGKRSKSLGVTRLIRLSVHWADKITAMSNSKGLV